MKELIHIQRKGYGLDNPFISTNSMLIHELGKQWALKSGIVPDAVIYQVGKMLDENIPQGFPEEWPYFHMSSDKVARKYFEANYPHTRHLIRIDLANINPHIAVKEI